MQKLTWEFVLKFFLACLVIVGTLMGITGFQASNPSIIQVSSTPTSCATLPLQVVSNTSNLYGTNGSGGCSQIGGSGGTVTGTGTGGYLPAWTGSGAGQTALGNSHINDGISTAGFITTTEPVAITSTAGLTNVFTVTQNSSLYDTTTCSNTGSRCDSVKVMNGGTTASQIGRIIQANATEYWRDGVTAFEGVMNWDVRDSTAGKYILQFGNNVYTGTNPAAGLNAAGLVLNTVQTVAARKGTFVCTNAGTITISNTNELVTSDVVISMNTAGGTITTPPAMKTVTTGTGFTVLCGATDTSTYNYTILN